MYVDLEAKFITFNTHHLHHCQAILDPMIRPMFRAMLRKSSMKVPGNQRESWGKTRAGFSGQSQRYCLSEYVKRRSITGFICFDFTVLALVLASSTLDQSCVMLVT